MKTVIPEVFEWEGLKSECYTCNTKLELEHSDLPIKKTEQLLGLNGNKYTEWRIQCPVCAAWIIFISDEDKIKIDKYIVRKNVEHYRNTK